MEQQIVGLKYTGTGFYDPTANNGLGEYKGYFVLVRPGQDNATQDKMRAFSSAGTKNGVRVRDGVIALTRKQAHERLVQIERKLAELEGKAQ